jgi:septal ring factor EnvC (AmiA/AmiB activator)
MIPRWSLALALAALCGRVAAQTSRIIDARRSLAELTSRQQNVAALVGSNRSELSRLLGALELFARDPPPALLVSPNEALDAIRGVILVRAIAPELEARAVRLSSESRELARVRRQVAVAESELFAAESSLEDPTSRIEGVASDAESLIPPGAPGAAAALHQGRPPTSLVPPADGRIVSGFGARLSDGGRSRGIAFHTAAGAAVVSPASGLVDYAGPLEGWGQVVILGAGGGYHLVLSGLARTSVGQGQKVGAGDSLGSMPSGGGAQPQLYLEVRLGGAAIDPTPLLREPQSKKPVLKRKLL